MQVYLKIDRRTTLSGYVDWFEKLFICGGQLPHVLLSGTVGVDIVRKVAMNINLGLLCKTSYNGAFCRAASDKKDDQLCNLLEI